MRKINLAVVLIVIYVSIFSLAGCVGTQSGSGLPLGDMDQILSGVEAGVMGASSSRSSRDTHRQIRRVRSTTRKYAREEARRQREAERQRYLEERRIAAAEEAERKRQAIANMTPQQRADYYAQKEATNRAMIEGVLTVLPVLFGGGGNSSSGSGCPSGEKFIGGYGCGTDSQYRMDSMDIRR